MAVRRPGTVRRPALGHQPRAKGLVSTVSRAVRDAWYPISTRPRVSEMDCFPTACCRLIGRSTLASERRANLALVCSVFLARKVSLSLRHPCFHRFPSFHGETVAVGSLF